MRDAKIAQMPVFLFRAHQQRMAQKGNLTMEGSMMDKVIPGQTGCLWSGAGE